MLRPLTLQHRKMNMSEQDQYTLRSIGGYRKPTYQEQEQYGPYLRFRFQAHFNETLPNGSSSFCGGLKRGPLGLWIATPWPSSADAAYGEPGTSRDEAVRNCVHLAIAQAMAQEAPETAVGRLSPPEVQEVAPPPPALRVERRRTVRKAAKDWYVDTIREAGPELLTTMSALLGAYMAVATKTGPEALKAAALIARLLADVQTQRAA